MHSHDAFLCDRIWSLHFNTWWLSDCLTFQILACQLQFTATWIAVIWVEWRSATLPEQNLIFRRDPLYMILDAIIISTLWFYFDWFWTFRLVFLLFNFIASFRSNSMSYNSIILLLEHFSIRNRRDITFGRRFWFLIFKFGSALWVQFLL